jgi:Ca2+-binding EF-hand superfamily protein
MNKLTNLLCLIALIFFLISVSAQTTLYPDRGPISFSAYDKDGDGLINIKEFNEVRAECISKQTANAKPMQRPANVPSFLEFDINNNGTLTQDELTAGQKIQMDKRQSMRQGGGMAKGMRMKENMPIFSDYDSNRDGKIIESEFKEARNKRISERAKQGYKMRNLGKAPTFSIIDTNGDGSISAEEFAVHQSQHRQKKNQ